MKYLLTFQALLITLITLSLQVNAQSTQDTTNLYIIETSDGNQFIGTVVSEDETIIELMTEKLGRLDINKADIVSIRKVTQDKIVKGKYWPENPQSSRYFWSPNGYGIPKGEGYYQNIWILWNQASFGVTDNFSMGVGLVPLFLFGEGGGEVSPIWVVPKFSIPVKKDKFNLGLGALAGTVGFKGNSGFGIAYGIGTFGSRDMNFSVGLGYGYAGGTWANTPLVTLSFMGRAGPRGYFISENFFISAGDETVTLLSFGGRSFVKRVAIDYGLFIPIVVDAGLFAIPWLGLTVPFKKKVKMPSER